MEPYDTSTRPGRALGGRPCRKEEKVHSYIFEVNIAHMGDFSRS